MPGSPRWKRRPDVATSYDVRIWGIEVYQGKRGNTYYVLWRVTDHRCKEAFEVTALAESFRAELMTARARAEHSTSALADRCRCCGRKHLYVFVRARLQARRPCMSPHVAATTRRSHAEAPDRDRRFPSCSLRSALAGPTARRYRLAPGFRHSTPTGAIMRSSYELFGRLLAWVERVTAPVADLARPAALRVLDGLTSSRRSQGAASVLTVGARSSTASLSTR